MATPPGAVMTMARRAAMETSSRDVPQMDPDVPKAMALPTSRRTEPVGPGEMRTSPSSDERTASPAGVSVMVVCERMARGPPATRTPDVDRKVTVQRLLRRRSDGEEDPGLKDM